jgi:hypothetical protein
MRRDDLYLNDIIEAADHIAAFIAGADFEAFQKSEMMRSAVVQKLAIIGEAAARVSEGLRSRHTEVPWPQIVSLPQHFDTCVFWHRLERSMAGREEPLPHFARAGHRDHRGRIRWRRMMRRRSEEERIFQQDRSH